MLITHTESLAAVTALIFLKSVNISYMCADADRGYSILY